MASENSVFPTIQLHRATDGKYRDKYKSRVCREGVIPRSGGAASYTEVESEPSVTTGPLPPPMSTLLRESHLHHFHLRHHQLMNGEIHENDQFEGRPAEAMQAKQQIEENIF